MHHICIFAQKLWITYMNFYFYIKKNEYKKIDFLTILNYYRDIFILERIIIYQLYLLYL